MRIRISGIIALFLLVGFSLDAAEINSSDPFGEYKAKIASEGLIVGQSVRCGSFTIAVVATCELGNFSLGRWSGNGKGVLAISDPQCVLVYDGKSVQREDLTGKEEMLQWEAILGMVKFIFTEFFPPREILKFFEEMGIDLSAVSDQFN